LRHLRETLVLLYHSRTKGKKKKSVVQRPQPQPGHRKGRRDRRKPRRQGLANFKVKLRLPDVARTARTASDEA